MSIEQQQQVSLGKSDHKRPKHAGEQYDDPDARTKNRQLV